jgi:hypothetical protein
MGNFSLTNPGLAYDQGQGVDPTTGMPVQLPPIVKYFKNAALRGHQAALDEMSTVQPARSTIAEPAGAPPQIPLSGEADSTQASTNPDPLSSTPRFVQPSFSSTTTDANGLQVPVNPAQTKLGKLVSILSAAARGAAAGWGTGNAAAGADRAREIPLQLAAQRQQLQTGSLENQQRLANLRALPLDIAQRQAAIEQMLEQTRVATEGTHNTVWQADPSNPGGMVQQSYDTFGRPVGSAIPAISPYLLKPKIHPVTYVGEDGMPHPGSQNLITGEVMSQDGSVVPNARVFEGSLVPKSATDTSSSSTDLMGNTKTTNRRVTAPVIAPGGNSAGGPGAGVSYPGASPTGAAATAGSARPPVNMVQKTAGGPLVAATNSPVPQPSGGGQPSASATPKTSSSPAASPIYALPSDVEQRLMAYSPDPKIQSYLRGLLSYQGQMPSPRAKNYAATLSALTSIDPSFNQANYDLIRKVKSDYTPGGTVGKQVLSFNTALNHMGMLADAAQQLQNGKLQLANKLANALSIEFGNDAVTNFNTIKTYLASELAKGFGGGVATDSSRAEAAPILNAIQSPQQLAGGFKTAADLLRGKISAQEAAYSQAPPLGTGQKVGLISDEGHGVLQKLGLESPQMLSFVDSNHQTHQILQSDWNKNKAKILARDPGATLIQ